MKRKLLAAAIGCGFFQTTLAATLSGTVTDGSGVYPLKGAQIRLQQTGQTIASDRQGHFRFGGLAAGSYTVIVSYLGAAEQTITTQLDSAESLEQVQVRLGDNVPLTENVVVIGQRGALNSALNQQRSADALITVLSADAIGQLPDENVAEAARRALGVSIQNDQGEGRFVSIRGANANLNTTSVNGVRVPSPEAEDRQVALDVIDADLLKNIVIAKSLTPDLDADAIGGNLTLETLSGLDQEGSIGKLKIAGVFSDLTEDWGEKISGTYATQSPDGRFGFAGSASWQSRDFGSENREVDGGWEPAVDERFPDEFELRNYDINRERLSLAANFDYLLTDNHRLFVNTLYNEFSDQEFRSRVENKFEDGDFAGMSGTVALVNGTEEDEYEVDRDIKDRLEEQTIYSIAIGSEWFNDLWTVDWSLATSQAEEDEPNRLDTAFRANFDSGQFGIDSANIGAPRLAFPDPAAEAAYFDPDSYALDAIELTNGSSEDEENALSLNVQRELTFAGNPGFVKAGVKLRERDKSYAFDLEVYEPVDDVLLTGFANQVDFPLDRIGTVPSAGAARDFFNANRDNPGVLELNLADTLIESSVADYEAEEDVLAAYLMAQAEVGKLRLTGGVRVEQTDFSASGFVVDEDAIEDTTSQADLVVLTADDDYTDVFPSINARYAFNDNLIGRAAYYASAIRPNFAAIAPRALTNEDLEVEAGNPTLDRQQADNIDLSIEWYPNGDSVLTAGIFVKRIDDFIAATFTDTPGVFNGLAYNELTTFDNLEDADIFGVELGYQQALDRLPAPFDGLIVGLNYTYVDAEAELASRKVALPGQAENIANLILGYDKGPWDLRAALSYRDEFIDELDSEDGNDRIVLDHLQLDFTAKYAFSDQLQGFVELKNLNDEPFEVVRRYAEGDFLAQFEEYGWSGRVGVALNF